MRHGFLFLTMLLAPTLAFGQNDDSRAQTLAQEILDRGATLFDSRDAAAMAATYIEGAEVILIKRDADSSRTQLETVTGRAAIEKGYADIFKDRQPEHRSRNTVDRARFLGPNLLLIEGRFALNRDQGDFVQFVQVRTREDDQWKVVTMQLMMLPSQNP